MGESTRADPASGVGVQRACAWSGVAFIVLWLVGFWVLADFVPPYPPGAGAEEVAGRFRDNLTGIRIGLWVTVFASALILPFFSTIAVQMKRIEGRRSPLTYTMIAASAVLTLEFILPAMWWQVAAYRPDEDPEFVRRFHDMAWLMFLGVTSVGMLQGFLIAAAILQDRRERTVFPRWGAYVNIWVVLMFIPGSCVVFTKSGPFAWNGVLAWWLGLVAYMVWTAVNVYLLLGAIKHQETEEPDGPTDVDELAARVAELRAEFTRRPP